jgi:hypothetical protein
MLLPLLRCGVDLKWVLATHSLSIVNNKPEYSPREEVPLIIVECP